MRAACKSTHEYVYMAFVEKPDYVTIEIIEKSLLPLFNHGALALFESLLEAVANPEDELAPAY